MKILDRFGKVLMEVEGDTLSGANLYDANLRGAKGLNPHIVTPLLMLHDQPGQIVAYKLVDQEGEGLYNGGIVYEIGKTVEVKNADTDCAVHCGAGINLATLDWCLREWREGCRVLKCQFMAEDIAAIPTATDGKFRVHRCEVVGEVDLKEIGWPPEAPEGGSDG